MNKRFLLNTCLLAGAMMFAACDYNEDNFDGLSDGYVPTDVKKVEYTLTAADYKLVSNSPENKAKVAAHPDSALMKQKLALVGKLGCFNDSINAEDYLMPVLAKQFYMADDGSAVKATFEVDNQGMDSINSAKIYTVSNADYESIWNAPVHYFTPEEPAEKHVPAFLAAAPQFANAQAGSVAFVDYKVSDIKMEGAPVDENFEGKWTDKNYNAVLEGWVNIPTVGSRYWGVGKAKDGSNFFLSASSHNSNEENEIYMISPRVKVQAGMVLTFDACHSFHKEEGGRLTVLLLATNDDLSQYSAEQIAAAKWVDITEPLHIEEFRGNFAPAYEKDLSEYAGKNVYIAFRYNGDNTDGAVATTTVQLDNVLIKKTSTEEVKPVPATGVFEFDGTEWKQNEDVYSMVKADFLEMGGKYDNFSNSMKAEDYLPLFLANKYPYAQEGKVEVVVYKFHKGKEDVVRVSRYRFADGAWTPMTTTETMTQQFVRSQGEWMFDPSILIELPADRSNQVSTDFYKMAVDWVWQNVDVKQLGLDPNEKPGKGYVKSFGDSECYSGCSYHYNNVDMSPDKAYNQYPLGYADETDAEGNPVEPKPEVVQGKMIEHLVEVVGNILPEWPEAKALELVPGVDLYCTVRFTVYVSGKYSVVRELKYKLLEPGKFEYVKGSFEPLPAYE